MAMRAVATLVCVSKPDMVAVHTTSSPCNWASGRPVQYEYNTMKLGLSVPFTFSGTATVNIWLMFCAPMVTVTSGWTSSERRTTAQANPLWTPSFMVMMESSGTGTDTPPSEWNSQRYTSSTGTGKGHQRKR